MKKCEYCVVYDKHQCEHGYCSQAIDRMIEMESSELNKKPVLPQILQLKILT